MKLNIFYNAYKKRIFAGILAQENGHIFFEYAPDFIKTGIEISPFKLPLKSGVFESKERIFDGLFGVFNDSLPDGWGCLLLDRKLQKQGLSYQSISPLARLSMLGTNPMGALEYEPTKSDDMQNIFIDLDKLSDDADTILDGKSEEVLDTLLQLNGSSGGARPKITALVSDDKKNIVYKSETLSENYTSWLIKFTNKSDRKDMGLHEYVYSLMAKKVGIDMPETYLFPSKFSPGHFGVKRFDRNFGQKIHIHTACGLLHADFRCSSLDYANLLKLTWVLTKNMQEVEKIVKLMIFNVKTGNKDDHSKNFSFMLDNNNAWKLAPAYDLTKSEGINGQHTAMVCGKGKDITDADLITEAGKVGISAPKVREIISMVDDVVADYEKLKTECR